MLRPAVRLDEPDGLLDRALLVRADGEAEVARVDVLLVGGQGDPAARRRDALDADEDVHAGAQPGCGSFSGSNSGVAADDGDRHRVALAEVLDERASCRPTAYSGGR